MRAAPQPSSISAQGANAVSSPVLGLVAPGAAVAAAAGAAVAVGTAVGADVAVGTGVAVGVGVAVGPGVGVTVPSGAFTVKDIFSAVGSTYSMR